MPATQQLAYLVAVVLPVVVTIAVNAYLFAMGERHTLLMPVAAAYPTIEFDAQPLPEAEEPVEEDEPLRKAA